MFGSSGSSWQVLLGLSPLQVLTSAHAGRELLEVGTCPLPPPPHPLKSAQGEPQFGLILWASKVPVLSMFLLPRSRSGELLLLQRGKRCTVGLLHKKWILLSVCVHVRLPSFVTLKKSISELYKYRIQPGSPSVSIPREIDV